MKLETLSRSDAKPAQADDIRQHQTEQPSKRFTLGKALGVIGAFAAAMAIPGWPSHDPLAQRTDAALHANLDPYSMSIAFPIDFWNRLFNF